jgi:lipopolysaccharide transport system permease protein
LLPVLIQVWMFASPIIYPVSLVLHNGAHFIRLNPLVGIVEGFRSSFLSLPFDWKALGIVAVVTFLMLGYVGMSTNVGKTD